MCISVCIRECVYQCVCVHTLIHTCCVLVMSISTYCIVCTQDALSRNAHTMTVLYSCNVYSMYCTYVYTSYCTLACIHTYIHIYIYIHYFHYESGVVVHGGGGVLMSLSCAF